MDYTPSDIEKKWQKIWAEQQTYKAENNSAKQKYYVLDMFPYPSGAGLHVGHPLGYIASDIISRYKRLQGFNVLHPMGYDSFGLPAEQYAIQTGQHPSITTEKNISRYREQLDKIGFSFDWSREVRTSDPNYYKWTQWIFIQLFHSYYDIKQDQAKPINELISIFESRGFNNSVEPALTGGIEKEIESFTADEWKKFPEEKQQSILMNFRLAYLDDSWVNWCPALGTVLANDEVKDGVSERGGHPVERKLMKQWSLRITSYAQRLLDGLDTIDWSESIKEAQRNWIGRSEGASIFFDLSPALSKGEGVDFGKNLVSEGEGGSQNVKNDSEKLSDGLVEYGFQEEDDNFIAEYKVPAYITTDTKKYNALKQFALNMRKNPTPAENCLWQALRRDITGFHIRRQHIVGPFIVDFLCLRKKLVIEVDGDIHDFRKEEDLAREEFLKLHGFSIIRFTNDEVLDSTDVVTKKIKAALESIVENSLQLDNKAINSLPLGEGQGGVNKIEVFTTRPDTIFGATFLVIAPEHELVEKITTPDRKEKIDAYVTYAKNRSERERMADVKTISGEFTGAYAIHPFTNEKIQIWIADYVLSGYGTGAVMAVPCGDQRDYVFAKHFGLEIKPLFEGIDISEKADPTKDAKLINSDFLNGLNGYEAIKVVIKKLEELGIGKGKINYRLRDAIFGRQRYWGEPIPIYYKNGIPYTVAENDLPVTLPEVDKYLPTEDGEPPLARANNWKYVPTLDPSPEGKEGFPMELTTMPGWAGSSWYFLRYMDPTNETAFASKEAMNYWKEVDLYIGGAEHATGHLLYFRFWTKFLKDLGYISIEEPAKKLINQGMIQGMLKIIYRINNTNKFISKNQISQYETTEVHIDINLTDGDIVNIEAVRKWRDDFKDAEFICDDGIFYCHSEIGKMSKRWHNVVNPDDLCDKFGADTLRCYEMFLGPLEQHKPWDTKGIEGTSRFLKKLWRLFHNETGFIISEEKPTKEEYKSLHKCMKKMYDDLERYSFNTVVSTYMICVNELGELKCNKREILENLVVLISPYAPHIAEELWSKLGHTTSVSFAKLPVFNPSYLEESSINYPIQFNGKLKFNLELSVDMSPADIEKEVLANEQTQKILEGKNPKKVIVVPKRIVNIVV